MGEIFDKSRRATQSLLKIQKNYGRFLKQRLKAFEARRKHAGGGAGGLVSPGGAKPLKNFAIWLLETPWFAYLSIIENAKNNAQEDYSGYKKAFGWYKVVIVKVSIQATW